MHRGQPTPHRYAYKKYDAPHGVNRPKHDRPAKDVRKFDLNIEEVLDGWEAYHGMREIIANALDEQALTGTPGIEIRKAGSRSYLILDRGRGIRPEHLTQNEDKEKMSGKVPVIGRFGVGLKDALAVLNRRGVKVRLRSRHCSITTEPAKKHGFDDITTLHALVAPPDDPEMAGTEVMLEGVSDAWMESAKSLFRRFSDECILESAKYGDILERKPNRPARIYVNGVQVAAEDNFLFSYDITKPTEGMRRMLNRERTNVGRKAYTERVKSILMAATSDTVMGVLAGDVARHEAGSQSDETKWSDVATRACKLLNASGNVVFATAGEQRRMAAVVDESGRDGFRMVTVPDNIRGRLAGSVDESGGKVRDMAQYMIELNGRFEFKFVEPDDLTASERRVWDRTGDILGLVGMADLADGVRISETMRPGMLDADGLWDGTRITMRRSTLQSTERYAGVLLHEAAHSLSMAKDVTREFESALTDMLGDVAACALLRGQ